MTDISPLSVQILFSVPGHSPPNLERKEVKQLLLKGGHDAAFPSKLNGFDDPSFSRVHILPQRSCAVGSIGFNHRSGVPREDKTDGVRD